LTPDIARYAYGRNEVEPDMSAVDKHLRTFGKAWSAEINGWISMSGGDPYDATAFQNSYGQLVVSKL
jgi:hypothetical protein